METSISGLGVRECRNEINREKADKVMWDLNLRD